MRLAVVTPTHVLVYEGRKHVMTFERNGDEFDATSVEQARTMPAAPLPEAPDVPDQA